MDGWTNPVSTEISEITDALSLLQRLVSGAVGRPAPPAVAVEAFRRLHCRGEPGAFDSALLLCTDWRWRDLSAKVISGIVDSCIFDDGDQDRLADTLLWQEQVHYRHPFWWIGTTFVEYDLESPGPGQDSGGEIGWNRTSSSARLRPSRSLRRARTCASDRHSCSAHSIASGSTRIPLRSYRLRDRLHRTSTAERRLARFARLVSAASPDGRKTRWPRSAQSRHSGPGSSMNSKKRSLTD